MSASISCLPDSTFSVTVSTSGYYRIIVRVANGTNCATAPAFTVGLYVGSLTSPDYAPYVTPTTLTLPTLTEPLRSLPDGTHDTLTINRDGSGTVTRRVGTKTFTGSESVSVDNWRSTDSLYGIIFSNSALPNISTSVATTVVGCMSDVARGVTYANAYGNSEEGAQVAVIDNSNYSVCVKLPKSVASSKNQMLAALTGHSVTYPLATPTTETVPASAMPSIPSQFLTAWLDAEDEDGAAITADYGITYERSLNAVIGDIEQAIADL